MSWPGRALTSSTLRENREDNDVRRSPYDVRRTEYRVQSTEYRDNLLIRPAPSGGFVTHGLLEKERGRGKIIKNETTGQGTTGKKQETGGWGRKEPFRGGRRVGWSPHTCKGTTGVTAARRGEESAVAALWRGVRLRALTLAGTPPINRDSLAPTAQRPLVAGQASGSGGRCAGQRTGTRGYMNWREK